MPVIDITRSLIAGVQKDLIETWRQKMPEFKGITDWIIKWLPANNIRHADYVFKEAVPAVRLWLYNTKRFRQTFKDRFLTVPIYPYDLTIPFSHFDEQDDQAGDTRTHVNNAVNRYKQLPIRLLSEYFNGVANLNPALANCYDGVGLYSALDGAGAARLSATGGNIVTISGYTPAAIIHDLAAVQRRFLDFLDPAGQPIFDEDDVSYTKLRCIVPKEMNELFQRVTGQEFIRSDPLSNTSESNYIKGTFKYEINSYMTDETAWYVVVEHPFYKPFAYRAPSSEKDIRTIISDFNNSDHARDTNEYALYSDTRVGLSPWFPGCTIKVA